MLTKSMYRFTGKRSVPLMLALPGAAGFVRGERSRSRRRLGRATSAVVGSTIFAPEYLRIAELIPFVNAAGSVMSKCGVLVLETARIPALIVQQRTEEIDEILTVVVSRLISIKLYGSSAKASGQVIKYVPQPNSVVRQRSGVHRQ
jgi:hypothetical protein